MRVEIHALSGGATGTVHFGFVFRVAFALPVNARAGDPLSMVGFCRAYFPRHKLRPARILLPVPKIFCTLRLTHESPEQFLPCHYS